MKDIKSNRRVWHRDRFIFSPTCVETKCVVCEKAMWLPPSKAGNYKTCGEGCRKSLESHNKELRKRACVTCGTEFYPRATQINAGNGLFCSQKCNVIAHAAIGTIEAQNKARMAWKRTHNESPFTKRGEDNPRWNGGKRARYLRQKEAGSYRKYGAKRRALMIGKLPPGTVGIIGEKQKWKCAVCGTGVKNSFELDHIVPLSRGGTHTKCNVQILCMHCNRSKGAKDPIAFMQSKGMLL